MTFLRQIALSLIGLVAMTGVVVAEEPLPRVLIIGDSVYRDMSRDISSQLSERVEVVVASTPNGVVLSSSSAIEHIETLLDGGEWDVIHFNCGLGDLAYRAPGMSSFRMMPYHVGGVRTTSPVEYEENLRALVRRLKQTESKLIWASTTPIRHSSTRVFQLESEIEYNDIAARVMMEENIPINDMYEFVLARLDMTRPAAHGADPFFFDRKPIHEQVVNAVLQALDMPLDRIEPIDD